MSNVNWLRSEGDARCLGAPCRAGCKSTVTLIYRAHLVLAMLAFIFYILKQDRIYCNVYVYFYTTIKVINILADYLVDIFYLTGTR